MEESSKELSGILTKEGDVFKAEREGVCDMCEECDGVQKWDMGNECGAECKIGADRDEDGTMDVWCISEGQSAELQ